MSDNRSSLDILCAFLLGGMVGAGLALLYAPRTGEETRKRIKEEIDELEEKARKSYDSAKDKVEEGVGKVRELVDEKTCEIKNTIKEKARTIKKPSEKDHGKSSESSRVEA